LRAAFVAVSLFLVSLPGRGAITGTVIGSDGRALARARVAAFALETAEEQRARWVSSDPARKPLVTVVSDSSGSFAIDPKVPVADLRIEMAGQTGVSVRAAANEDAGVLQVPMQPLVRAVITANGKPLPGATVIVRSGGTESVATTDALGQYWLPDPKRVPSRLLIRHPNYAPMERELDTITSRTADLAMSSGVSLNGQVVAADGQTPVASAIIQIDDLTLATTGADGMFSIEHAPPGGRRIVARAGDRIAARLLEKDQRLLLRLGLAATITGSVRDLSSGMAIAGAQVTAAAPRFDGPDAGAWTITDDKGNYAITGLAGGEYELTAVHPGYATPRLVVNAPAGGAMRKVLYTSVLARIAGSVVDESSRAIGGVAISVRRVGGDMVWMPAWVRGPQRAVTAPNGRFLLRTAEEGSILLDARKAGLPSAHSGIIHVAAGARTAGIVITISRGVALTGRVITSDRKPVAGAAIAASEAGEGGAHDQEDVVRTKADGTFSMRLREGAYDLVITAPGHAPRTLRAQVSANAAPLEVTLEPGVEISGRVTRGGSPVEGVDVFTISGTDIPPVRTGFDGRFRITDLAPGDVMLAFKKPSDFIQAKRAVTAPANDVDVNLPDGGRIAGRVIDKSTQQPVKSFDAGVSSGGAALMITPAMRAFAGDDGTFVIDGVPAGSHTLAVTAPGYVMARIPNVNVESGKSVDDLEVALEHGVRVSGRVTGPDGGAAGGVLVRIDPAASTRGAALNDPFTMTDPDGGYLLDGLDPGPTTLAFSRGGLLTVRKNVTLSGSSPEVDAQLGAGSSISGLVVLDSGEPVGNAEVRAWSAAEATDQSALTDESGTFAIASVAAGHYEITAAKAGSGSATLHDVEIPAAGTLRIQIKKGGVIEGRLTGLSPAEVHSTTVQAWSTDGGNASASADETGHYRIDGAPAGTVRVNASARTPAGSVRNAATKSVQLVPGTTANVDFDFAADIVVSGRITRNGTPLPGVAVSFVPASAAQRYARTVADGNGRYEITGVDNGSYTVTVLDTERGPYSTRAQVNGSSTFDIDLKGVRLAGRVSDASTDGAIADALVELRRTNAGVSDLRSTLSDANGGFSFDEVVAGSFEARVQRAGYGAVTVGVAVSEAGAPPLEVKLSPSSGMALRVVDGRDARPLNGWYHAEAGSGESFDGAIIGTAEPARIALATGSYRLTVGASGYAPRTRTIAAPGEETIALTPGGTIIVSSTSETFAFLRIIDATGQPIRFGPGPATGTIRIDPAPGQTRIANVTPGTYVVQLVVDGNVLRSAPVTVREGETVPARL
jgi:protocatechuate 3,4-dioxygenase beta subunit